MASRKNGALYIGVTSDLEGRVWDHKNGHGSAHVKQYKIFNLVYCHEFQNINDAIDDEKRMKAWKREWKIKLIEEHNPNWDDLAKIF
jgi:putative endonuclease